MDLAEEVVSSGGDHIELIQVSQVSLVDVSLSIYIWEPRRISL